MLIANPIYDTVFKYLMKNIDIARGIISAIIDQEIVHLSFKAQENIFRSETALTVYHLDFIAGIRMKDGGYKNVLIELQKANISYDIMRFRKYVGEQYKKEDEVHAPDGEVSKEPLPIITVYILGFRLSKTLPAVIKVNRQYLDVLGGGEITERNAFIERLTHDSYVIQVPSLHTQMKNRLEYVLSIFQQENFIDDGHFVKAYNYEPEDELMKIILNQLAKAAADTQLLRELELEEQARREYENAVGPLEKKLRKQQQKLEEKEKAQAEKAKALAENARAIEEKDKALAEKEKQIAELMAKLKKSQ